VAAINFEKIHCSQNLITHRHTNRHHRVHQLHSWRLRLLTIRLLLILAHSRPTDNI